MPKVTNTRRERAAKLLERLQRGPHFVDPIPDEPLTADLASRAYRCWAQSWILDDLQDLVPELRQLAATKEAQP